MKIITYNNFKKGFNMKKINKNTFKNTYKVNMRGKIISLQKYIKDKKINMIKLNILLNIINNKETYLRQFYKKSLQVNEVNFEEDYEKTKKIPSNNLKPMYKNIIRNLYYKEILEQTNTSLDNLRTYLCVLKDLFNNKIIDYKLLTPSG
jgi:hypothetical protein